MLVKGIKLPLDRRPHTTGNLNCSAALKMGALL
jgi:hypothetical protein